MEEETKSQNQLQVQFNTLQLIAMGFWIGCGFLLFALLASIAISIAGVFLGLFV